MLNTIACIILVVALFAVVLWIAICTLLMRVAHKVKGMSRSKWWKSLLIYIKERSRRRLFYAFLGAETAVAGGIIPLSAKLWFANSKFNLLVELSDQSNWVSFVVAILIAAGFFYFINRSDTKNPQKWNELLDQVRFINNELRFSPSKQWFEKQNELAIKALDKRYSPDINFPFEEMDWLLASLRIKDEFKGLMWNELDNELKSIKSYLNHIKKQVIDDVRNLCQDVIMGICSIDGNMQSYKYLQVKVNALLENLHDISAHGDELNDYVYRDLINETYLLDNTLEKIWFDIKDSKCWIIAGEAGMGKSHLIGDIVTHRKKLGEPTVLLLGQHFTNNSDPYTQIKERLGVICRAESVLEQLNEYGKRVGKAVVIIIDALNEGAGDSLWRNYWNEVIAKIESFEFLRFVVSFRVSGNRNWFYDLAHDQKKIPVYFHEGFKNNEQLACEFMFRSYGLEQPLWPAYGPEFANPLFLKTYCRLHEKTEEPLQLDNFWETVNRYCKWVNHELSVANDYSDSLPLVFDAMCCIASLMVQQGSRWQLEYEKVNESMVDVAKYFKDPKEFLRIMIDEGLLRMDNYGGDDYINFGYELLGDFFLANCLLKHGNIDSTKMWSFGEGVPEAMAVIAPYSQDVEFFEIVTDNAKDDALQALIDSSGWRDSFTDKGRVLIRDLYESKDYEVLFQIILKRPFRSDDVANSTMLHDILWPLGMAERDSVWTQDISHNWGIGQDVMELAKWGINVSEQALKRVDVDLIRRCAETLVWTFSSSNRILRDTATHALAKILAERKDLILPLLVKYYKVNDPYIEERLWAAIFGALTCCQEREVVESVAKWVYGQVFQARCVSENILVRDYAKSIVRYALSLGADIDIDERLLSLPFTNQGIPVVPTCDEIKAKYESEDWRQLKDDELDVWRAKQAILCSMATEHSPRTNCHYGDFGRYVFQANVSFFSVDPEMMSNWAIQMIFDEYGYDPKLFQNFDINIRYTGRSRNVTERIGKKYQWIALYRILARLSDAYPDLVANEFYTLTQCVRNIDTTYRFDTTLRDNRRSKYFVPLYDLTKPKDNMKWLRGWRKMPEIKKYLFVKDTDGEEWVNLFSYNTIKCPKELTEKERMMRDLWTFIQAFTVKKEHIKTVCRQIYLVGLEGRRFRENREIDSIYSREYFWSDIYREMVKEEDYGFAPFTIGHRVFPNIEVAPTYLIYSYPSSEDASNPKGVSMLMPNEWLYKGLGLEYGKLNGVWVDGQGKIVVVDNAEYGKGHSALLVRKNVILNHLNREGLTLFWPVLNERETRVENGVRYEQNGGWAYMDEKGELHYMFRTYVPTKFISKHKLKKLTVGEEMSKMLEDDL